MDEYADGPDVSDYTDLSESGSSTNDLEATKNYNKPRLYAHFIQKAINLWGLESNVFNAAKNNIEYGVLHK